jgi:hypothetical protein
VCGVWLEDIESLEAISQDEETRRLVLRMAAMSGNGGLQPFLRALAADGDLDDTTKGALAELARDPVFLHAVEDYVRRTRLLH